MSEEQTEDRKEICHISLNILKKELKQKEFVERKSKQLSECLCRPTEGLKEKHSGSSQIKPTRWNEETKAQQINSSALKYSQKKSKKPVKI